MKKIVAVAVTALLAFATSASADVSAIKLRFGGGCTSSNTNGICILKASASGTDLGSETVRVYTGADQKSLKLVSKRTHALSSSGGVVIRATNNPGGCFQVKTGPNGNDKPDVSSNKVCE